MKNKFDMDSPILLTVLALSVLGVVMVYSASSFKAQELHQSSNFFLISHAYKLLFGIGIMIAAAHINYKVWLQISPVLMLIAAIMLLLLLFGTHADQIRGSRRWLDLGFIRCQPSDFARISLILFLSFLLGARRTKQSAGYREFLLHLMIPGFIILLIVGQPDVGTALLLSVISLALIFVSGERLRYLASLVVFSAPLIFFYLMQGGYKTRRLVLFWHSVQGKEVPWQTKQSLIAFGNGYIAGLGLGAGKQKYHFLPDPFTDFIYAILGEELGFIGALLVLVLFSVFVWYGFQIALQTRDKQGKLLAFGIVFNIAVYAFTNAGVVLNLLPTTGIPMPFLSYGGSALLVNMFGIGILLNLSSQVRKQRRLAPVREYARRRVVAVR